MQVAKVMRFREFDEGDEVCRQGDEGDTFYIVVTGSVGKWHVTRRASRAPTAGR